MDNELELIWKEAIMIKSRGLGKITNLGDAPTETLTQHLNTSPEPHLYNYLGDAVKSDKYLLIYHEDGGREFLRNGRKFYRNIRSHSDNTVISYELPWEPQISQSNSIIRGCSTILFYPEDGGGKFLRKSRCISSKLHGVTSHNLLSTHRSTVAVWLPVRSASWAIRFMYREGKSGLWEYKQNGGLKRINKHE
jgi:hypothetical protein